MTSPEKIGAFFDLDGTLVAPPSLEWRFIGHLLAHDEIGSADIARWLARFAKTILLDPRAATSRNKMYLAGLCESLAVDWEISPAPAAPEFSPQGIERLAWHVAEGHRIFLVSGTLAPLARAVARRLPGPIEVCATELEVRGGRWTGRISTEHMSGKAKARAVRNLAARYGLALWNSYAYGNSIADLPMLDSVGHPMAVNPPSSLRRIARNEGWQSCDWPWPTAASTASRPRQLSPKEAR